MRPSRGWSQSLRATLAYRVETPPRRIWSRRRGPRRGRASGWPGPPSRRTLRGGWWPGPGCRRSRRRGSEPRWPRWACRGTTGSSRRAAAGGSALSSPPSGRPRPSPSPSWWARPRAGCCCSPARSPRQRIRSAATPRGWPPAGSGPSSTRCACASTWSARWPRSWPPTSGCSAGWASTSTTGPPSSSRWPCSRCSSWRPTSPTPRSRASRRPSRCAPRSVASTRPSAGPCTRCAS